MDIRRMICGVTGGELPPLIEFLMGQPDTYRKEVGGLERVVDYHGWGEARRYSDAYPDPNSDQTLAIVIKNCFDDGLLDGEGLDWYYEECLRQGFFPIGFEVMGDDVFYDATNELNNVCSVCRTCVERGATTRNELIAMTQMDYIACDIHFDGFDVTVVPHEVGRDYSGLFPQET